MPFRAPGFSIDDLFLATEGHVSTYTLDPGAPREPGLARDELAARYGIDLRFPGDLLVAANGDFQLTAGIEGFRQVFTRALITSPNELFWTPEYGIGITEFLNVPASAASAHELQNRIRTFLEGQPDVNSIDQVEVRLSPTGGTIELYLRFTLEGVRERLGLLIRGGEDGG